MTNLVQMRSADYCRRCALFPYFVLTLNSSTPCEGTVAS